nr:CoA transferase [Hyphomonas sp. Mor2]
MSDPQQALPLDGIKVIELSTMITASFATMMLAALGAEVIKVEPNDIGDPMRYIGTQKDGISALFANCNRGKRSLAVNLKDPDGQALVQALAKDADIIIHNYRAGVMEKLSLGREQLRRDNPRLIFAAVSGFGREGPMAKDPAYDQVVQALSGFTDIQAIDGAPQLVNTLIADKVTAYTVVQGIQSALLTRERTGKGQDVDVSMLQACIFFLFPDGMMNQTLLAEDALQQPALRDQLRTYACADGRVTIAPATQAHWMALLEFLGQYVDLQSGAGTAPDSPEAFVAEIATKLAALLITLPVTQVIEGLKSRDIPCAPCLTVGEVVEQDQVRAIGAVAEQNHPRLGDIRVAEPPIRFDGFAATIEGPCPALGEHSMAIAQELGLSAAEIEKLLSDRVITGRH